MNPPNKSEFTFPPFFFPLYGTWIEMTKDFPLLLSGGEGGWGERRVLSFSFPVGGKEKKEKRFKGETTTPSSSLVRGGEEKEKILRGPFPPPFFSLRRETRRPGKWSCF